MAVYTQELKRETQVTVLESLLAFNANINSQNFDGMTPLHFAASR